MDFMINTSDKSVRSLAIVLAWKDPAWISLLESEGLAWELLDTSNLTRYPPEVMVIPRQTPAKIYRICSDLVSMGTTAIAEILPPDSSASVSRVSFSFPYHREDYAGLENNQIPGAVSVSCICSNEGKWYHLPFSLVNFWCAGDTGRKCLMVDPARKIVVFERLAQIVKKISAVLSWMSSTRRFSNAIFRWSINGTGPAIPVRFFVFAEIWTEARLKICVVTWTRFALLPGVLLYLFALRCIGIIRR